MGSNNNCHFLCHMKADYLAFQLPKNATHANKNQKCHLNLPFHDPQNDNYIFIVEYKYFW